MKQSQGKKWVRSGGVGLREGGAGTELNSLAWSPRLLLDESKSRVMQVARGRRDVFLLAYEQYIRMGREGRGGEVSPPPGPRPPANLP